MPSADVDPSVAKELALQEIRRSRAYVGDLIENIESDAWFATPAAGVSTIAWQVGHLAMAEYRLCLHRLRGVRVEDEALITTEFLAAFGKGSVPSSNADDYPTREELLSTFRAVHERALVEISAFPSERLHEPPEAPHRLCASKIECLWWRVRHEMVHAGQVALLRRQLGAAPLW